MKKLLVLFLIGSSAIAVALPLHAQEHRDAGGITYGLFGWGQGIEQHLDHLNRMVGHVRWQMGSYHADGAIRRDFEQIRREVNGVNERYRAGGKDRREVGRQIQDLHARLHQLEVRMRVPEKDCYNWR
jgi:hypothetical protein